MSDAGRSRWDQSASPAASRSPAGNPAADAAAAAAAAAAKIAAQYAPRGSGAQQGMSVPALHDAPFTKDIDVNDLRNRYMLTKGATQQKIFEETGASVTTKGTWYPDRSKATENDPPLFLHVAATSQEILDKAVATIEELKNQELGPLIEDRGKARREYEERIRAERNRKWDEEKVYINLEPLRNFNVRAKVVGPSGLFVKYIQSETGTRVQIKGRGSGFFEPDTGAESTEPMHISISGPDSSVFPRAKELADDLLIIVRQEWEKARQASMQPPMGYGGYPGYPGYGYPAPPPPSEPAPPPPPGGEQPPPPPPADGQPPAPGGDASGANGEDAFTAYWAAYGYNVKDPAFIEWQKQQQQQYAAYYAQYPQAAQQAGATPGGAPAPPPGQPPAPPAEEQRREGQGVYGAVPPPPGL